MSYDPSNEEYGFRLDAKVTWFRRSALWWASEIIAAAVVAACILGFLFWVAS